LLVANVFRVDPTLLEVSKSLLSLLALEAIPLQIGADRCKGSTDTC
jgi:hypothetical protein